MDLADIRGNEIAKRAVVVCLAGNYSIEFVGPDDWRDRFRGIVESMGIVVDFPGRAQIVVHVEQPPDRDLKGKLIGTSTEDVWKQVVNQREKPTRFDSESENILRVWEKEMIGGVDEMERLRVRDVAATIAALDCSEAIKVEHVLEAIIYMNSTWIASGLRNLKKRKIGLRE